MFGADEKVVCVDNKELFRKAVSGEGYKAYFSDMQYGDFGSLTAEGNRLLAGHTAEVIVKECLGKK
jgi:hypothetical protein